MKTYQSTTENIWHQIHRIVYNEQEKLILDSENEEDRDARKQIIELHKNEGKTLLPETESQKYIEIYNQQKPTLLETDKYVLLSIIVVEKSKKTSGIINYRINGEHKQIRF
jgi:hypothetical protein